MAVQLPIAEIAELRAEGLTLRAIGKRFGVSAPTIRRRLKSDPAPRSPQIRRPTHDPERRLARLMAATRHRFNHVTDEEARFLREIIGWAPLNPDDGETTCGD